MAEAKITISLDDESKELIWALVSAVEKLVEKPDADSSFADLPGGSYPVNKRLAEDGYFDEEDV